MSDKIKVNDILDKHFMFQNHEEFREQALAAVKEIVEKAIDMAADEADLKYQDFGDGDLEGGDKQSILNIKKLFDYD